MPRNAMAHKNKLLVDFFVQMLFPDSSSDSHSNHFLLVSIHRYVPFCSISGFPISENRCVDWQPCALTNTNNRLHQRNLS